MKALWKDILTLYYHRRYVKMMVALGHGVRASDLKKYEERRDAADKWLRENANGID